MGIPEILIIVGIVNAMTGLLVLARDYKKVQNLIFAIFTFGLAGWVIGIAGFLMAQDRGVALIWAKFYYFSPLVVAATMPIFSYTFPLNKKIPYRLILIMVGGLTSLAVPLFLFDGFVTEGLVYHDWGKEIVLNQLHYLFYSFFIIIPFSYSLFILFKKLSSTSGFYNAQTKFFFYGSLITTVVGITFNLLLPWYGNYRLIWVGPLFTSALMVAVGVNIVRHKMFDIRLVIARSLAYLFSLLAISAVYIFILIVLAQTAFGTKIEIDTEIFTYILAGFVLVTGLSPLKKYFNRFTNKLFYRDAYIAQNLIDELNEALVSNVDIVPMLEKSTSIISKHMKSMNTAFSIRQTSYVSRRIIGANKDHLSNDFFERLSDMLENGPDRVIVTDQLDDNQELLELLRGNDVSVVSRLAPSLDVESEGLGFLVMGSRQSGSSYYEQDIKVLETISNELVIAIQNALRYEEIQKFADTLQQKVDDATAELKHANEKLKQLDETKDDFISMASHQLRTPLTSVKGYLSMVLEGDAGDINDMQKKLLDQAFVSSQRMVFLIADLLNLSRLKTGKFVIDAVPTDLSKMVKDEVEQLKDTAKSRDLTLEYNTPPVFPKLMLDETKIRQVMMNFIDNAIYYTPAGGHIWVELKDTDKTVEFTVKDDGIGITKAEQAKLFTKFFRAGNAKKARPDGTGLGLFMVRKVIVAQGGTIIFQSQEGKGSTFGFSFEKEKLKIPEKTDEKPINI